MPTTEKLKKRLLDKLSELFQLNQPDLDFGFYRIMHAKSDQVRKFIDNDLLNVIQDSFGVIDDDRKASADAALKDAIEQAKKFGAPDPEATEGVKEARAKYEGLKDSSSAEADIYDHLYRFFERYYDNGDFISRRYYSSENSGKAAPFAIPYNGEEVKLHWANADQYYIKTAEYFSNFTFDVNQAKEIRGMTESERELSRIPAKEMKVHFQIVEASEGEHGNVKAADDKKRFFVLHEENPVELNEKKELVVNFEYKSLPGGKNGVSEEIEKELKEIYGSVNKGDMPNLEMGRKIIEAVSALESAEDYKTVFSMLAPTEKIKKRPLITKYINQYTARNTSDYFIHKDLGGFLKRELDFYIKNEVMHLDDFIPESWEYEKEKFETYSRANQAVLRKISTFRKIATKLIDFLAQLEDFQKKLWLKKKFVTETNYCITLDRIPEELYAEIAENDAQREEWIKLFAIDEIKKEEGLPGIGKPGYSTPLAVEFLKANDKLVLDTQFFDVEFKAKLIASIDNFDEQCDGLLIHSENFQAVNFLENRYCSSINCVYIDPPYNTTENAFAYKNRYKHSSWISLMQNRIQKAKSMITETGVCSVAIDDTETNVLRILLDNEFGSQNYVSTIAAEVNPAGQNLRPNTPARSHDYFHVYARNIDIMNMLLRGLTPEEEKAYKETDDKGSFLWDNLRRRGGNSRPTDRPKQWFPLYASLNPPKVSVSNFEGATEVWPIDPKGEKRIWRNNLAGAKRDIASGEISVIEKAGRIEIVKKSRMPEGKKPKTLWYQSGYSATSHGTKLLLNIIGQQIFSYPKSINLVVDALRFWVDKKDLTMDFFAGSGTTGHAVINLNREDNGNRKYILVEMGDYFDTVTKPRITKVIYSSEWKHGKPTSRDTGISQCFKCLRLESYEDTLNNLEFDKNETRNQVIKESKSLREDYMLNYMLDVETKGSQSLLSIDNFANPWNYTLNVKKPGSDEQVKKNIDITETFNYLIGLRLEHMAVPKKFTAKFIRKPDPELPEDQNTKLVIDGRIKERENGKWHFKVIEGHLPKDRMNPNNGQIEKVLIVWRNLTGNLEEDNIMLDEFFTKHRISTKDFEYDTIYVNGSNNLPNLKTDDDNWKVKLIEEEFHKKMWESE